MELLTGLFTHAKRVDLTNKDVIQLGIDICKALEVCQKYHIIHRDIKPENIFISDVGTYKLGDFGIAREMEKTSSGVLKKETRSYMAPEVYKGMEYNSTVDIYSLGIVLYRFLNDNRLPFLPLMPERIRYSDKETADIMRMSGHPMPAPIHASRELAEIVLKACAYVHSERYASAKEMREELETILHLEEEQVILFCKDIRAKTSKTGDTQEVTSRTFNRKVESMLNDTRVESTTLSTYEDTTAETMVIVSGINADNEKEEQKTTKRMTTIGGIFLLFFILCVAGVGLHTFSGDSKEQENAVTVTSSPNIATKEPTSEPTERPTAIPTKEPKKTKNPVTKRPTKTKAPIVTAAPVTKEPEVTKKPEKTKKTEEESRIIIDDPNVTVE